MSSKTIFLLGALLLVIIATLVQGVAMMVDRTQLSDQRSIRRQAVQLTQLPDLALSNHATWVRHRSLATPFSIFPDDGALLDYYPASFVYQIIQIPPKPRNSLP